METILHSFSVVVPIFNEEEVLSPFYERLKNVMNSLNEDYEIIFVNDGSTDHSMEELQKLSQSDPNVKIIEFSRNFGHQIAITAGLDHTNGQAIIIMDGDLQHPPEVIPKLIQKWKEGYEVVYTVKKETKDAGFFKNISASVFYSLMNKIGNIRIPKHGADFRLVDQKVLESLKLLRERSRFMRGLVNWVGYSQTSVEFEADARYAGATKYSLKRMIQFALDGITSFSSFPLRISTYFGFLVSAMSFLYAAFAIYARLFTQIALPGWTSILVAVLFLGGVQLITIGLLGEYIGRIYDEVKQRPLYLIKNKIGFE
jgi:dolichol-phosphate mannosyltransferase